MPWLGRTRRNRTRAAVSALGSSQRYERLAGRLLSGRFDDEVLDRLRARMQEPIDDGTPSTMVLRP